MITTMRWGAMYGQLEEGDRVSREVLQLGESFVAPGDLIRRIGSKDRTAFEMDDGYFLEYVGRVDRYILFISRPDGADGKPWYYVFGYVDPLTLVIGGASGCKDIRADEVHFAS